MASENNSTLNQHNSPQNLQNSTVTTISSSSMNVSKMFAQQIMINLDENNLLSWKQQVELKTSYKHASFTVMW
jgi:hypothetical protein